VRKILYLETYIIQPVEILADFLQLHLAWNTLSLCVYGIIIIIIIIIIIRLLLLLWLYSPLLRFGCFFSFLILYYTILYYPIILYLEGKLAVPV
jgi:hypothetical protein